MMRLERSTGSHRLKWWSIVGVLLVPIMMAGGFLAATWDSTARWNKVQAAIVNLDDPVEISGQLVPLGRQLTGGLVDADARADSDTDDQADPQNFNWVISDVDDAQDGLTDGRYAAVVTIPEDFSANATSYSKNDGDQAEQATIDIQTSKVGGVTDTAVAEAISSAAVNTMNSELSEQYLDNLYLGFNQAQQGMQKSADGASQLSDGVDQLSTGVGQSAKGAKQLSTGLDQLSTGTSKLSEGIDKTDTGAEELATGVGQLHKGMKQTDTGVTQLDSGVGKLDSSFSDFTDGTGKNAKGVKQYTKGVDSYVSGVDPFADGVAEYAGGVKKYVKGVTSYVDGADQLAGGVGDYVDGVGGYADGVDEYVNGTTKFASGVGQYTSSVSEYVDNVGPAAEQVADGVTSGVQQQSDDQLCEQAGVPALQCPLFAKAFKEGVKTGADQTAAGVKQALVTGAEGQPSPRKELKKGGKKLSAGADGVIAGGEKLSGAGDQLSSGGKELKTGATKLGKADKPLKEGGKQLSTSSTKIKKGATQLSGAGDQLTTGGDQLTTGAQGIDKGAEQLGKGVSDLHDGTGKLAEGTGKLVEATGQLKTGTSQLADGTGQLATAGQQLATGTKQSATGAKQLSDGMAKLNTGTEGLADGADELATGLDDGAEAMPTYSKKDRTQLATVASSPVSSEQPEQLFANETTTTLLMALALWVGGLVTYLVINAIPASTFGSSKSSVRLAMAGVLPGVVIGAVQAAALSTMLALLLDLSAGRFVGLLGFGLFAAVTFAMLNHALVAWFGGIGRFVSVLVAVLTAAGSLTYALPDFFGQLRPFLPTTPALDGFRAIVTDAPTPGAQVGTLLGWLVLAGAASLIAVARRRVAPALTLAA